MEQILTVLLTVISGVVVFILCEYIKEIWLTPLQDYKQIKKKISYAIVFYANIYSNPVDIAKYDDKLPDNYAKGSNEFRELASELRSFLEMISIIKVGIPKKKDIFDASSNMIGIANGFHTPYNVPNDDSAREHNEIYINEIRRLLKLFVRKY